MYRTKSVTLWALLLIAGAVSLPAQFTYPLNQGNPATDGFTSGGVANCQRGWRFRVNIPGVTVQQLGCLYPDGATQVKTLTLFNFTTQQIMAQVNTVPGAGWCWTNLTTPVPLTQNSEYVVQAFTTTVSYWFHNNPPAAWRPTGPIEYLDVRYANNCTANTFPTSTLSPHQYGVVDIGYSTGPTLLAAATPGTQQVVANNAQGPGNNGLAAADFTITSNSLSTATDPAVTSISIEAAGTGLTRPISSTYHCGATRTAQTPSRPAPTHRSALRQRHSRATTAH